MMKLIYRIFNWIRVLRYFQGIKLSAQFGLIKSAILDIFMSLFVKSNTILSHVNGIFYLRPLDVYVFIRKRTDDLYVLLPLRERNVELIIRKILKNEDVFVDIGSGLGYYTILASRFCRLVISIEANPFNYAVQKFIVKKINTIPNIVLFNYCLWNQKKSLGMIVPESKYFGQSRVVNEESQSFSLKVECIPGDKLLQNVERIKLIKIDVEGSEMNVLLGLKNTLEKVNYIIYEANTCPEKIALFLREKGFKVLSLGFENYFIAFKQT